MSEQMIRTLLATSNEEKWTDLQWHLEQYHFIVVDVVTEIQGMVAFLRKTELDLVLIDYRLVWAQGLSLYRRLQSVHPLLKIVLITNNDESLQLSALQAGVAGCIDYNLPLPEWPALLAYINAGGATCSRAVVERLLGDETAGANDPPLVTIGPLAIDLPDRNVTLNGRRLCLTPREFDLLACLVQSIGQVVTFDRLLNEAWRCSADCGSQAQVRSYITRLRRKLEDDPDLSHFIVTERGVGYRLRSPEQWRRVGQPG